MLRCRMRLLLIVLLALTASACRISTSMGDFDCEWAGRLICEPVPAPEIMGKRP